MGFIVATCRGHRTGAGGGTVAPSAPVLSLSSYTDTTIDVSCTSVSGATGYKFYKDGSLVATQAGTTYQYTGLSALTTYALTCKAYNGAGDSSVSNTVTQQTNFPVVSNSLYWIDWLNRSKTDTAGATPAAAGDAVWTVSLPTGWGASQGDGLIRQDTSARRPVLRSDGIQCDATGGIDYMIFPVALSLSDCTIYSVTSRPTSSHKLWILGNTANNRGFVPFDSPTNCYFDWTGTSTNVSDTVTGLAIRRLRVSSGNAWYKRGGSEANLGAVSGTFSFDAMLAGQSTANASSNSARFLGLVVVNAHLTPGGASDLAIIAALQTLYAGVSGP